MYDSYITCCTSSLACPHPGDCHGTPKKANAKLFNVCQIVANLCAVLYFPFLFFVHCRALYCMIFYQLAVVAAAAAAAVAAAAGFDTNFERCGAPQNIAQSVNMVEDF